VPSKYKPNQNKLKQNLPFLTGALIIIFSMDYLAFAFLALGGGESFYFLVSITLFAMLIASFLLLRHGVALEKIYNKSKYAKSSKIPYKTVGAVLLSSATLISAYLGSYTFVSSLMLGISVLVGWYLYYGFDPMQDKIEGYESSKSAQRIMKLLLRANEDISTIKKCANEINSEFVASLMLEMADAFDKIVQHIEDEPDDYDRARKYLVSYLGELKSMSETFVKLDAKHRTEEIQKDFIETLESSIEKLEKQYEKLLDDDLLDLDIKLSVMKKRLENEE